jgi:hypothetical protein
MYFLKDLLYYFSKLFQIVIVISFQILGLLQHPAEELGLVKSGSQFIYLTKLDDSPQMLDYFFLAGAQLPRDSEYDVCLLWGQ